MARMNAEESLSYDPIPNGQVSICMSRSCSRDRCGAGHLR